MQLVETDVSRFATFLTTSDPLGLAALYTDPVERESWGAQCSTLGPSLINALHRSGLNIRLVRSALSKLAVREPNSAPLCLLVGIFA